MKARKVLALSFAGLLLGLMGNDAAEAGGPGHRQLHHRHHHGHQHHRNHHHGNHHHGHHHHFWPRIVFYSAPLVVPRYYPAPVYYAPPPAPPVYIEQPQPQPDSQAYWYYCREAQAYYPHVQTCPGGWQRVAPQPPPG